MLLVLVGVLTLVSEMTRGAGDRAGWLTVAVPFLMSGFIAALFYWFPRKRVLEMSDDQRAIEYAVEAGSIEMSARTGSLHRVSLSSMQTAIFSSEVIVLQADSATMFPLYLRAFDPGDRAEATRRIESGIPEIAKIIRRS